MEMTTQSSTPKEIAMTMSDLERFLRQVTVEALHELVDGSTDPIAIQEILESHSQFRISCGCTQLLYVEHISDSEKVLTLCFSSLYLVENRYYLPMYELDKVLWKFKIPEYRYFEDPSDSSDHSEAEEGVVEWLVRAEIEILEYNPEILKLDYPALCNTAGSIN
jgi:hypothetical protein